MRPLLFLFGGILTGIIIHLIREFRRKQKPENKLSSELSTTASSPMESKENEKPKNPILSGDFLTDDILDKKFKEIAFYNLSLIKTKNSSKELSKIKFKKLECLVESILQFEPVDRSRNDKRLLIQYLKKVNRSINTITYRELLELERDYLFPILDKKDEYGWKYKNDWLLGLILTILVEILIWGLISLILSVFIEFNFYFVPFLSTYYLINSLTLQKKKKAERKIW
ncbi:hypothetical protein GCM10023115_38460 [Pontixanthobacter gangjinensis]|uniref:Uncharacterized protein n=1 Tax=Christiangramia aestuarii TaxID=1028746 RepID=A0A7K1LSZ6_9FLAO|nr:hypothetical protein [Christiangramia aestuarii]MUP43944.1 hypothetical protein [Christiangramia aestuarii]